MVFMAVEMQNAVINLSHEKLPIMAWQAFSNPKVCNRTGVPFLKIFMAKAMSTPKNPHTMARGIIP